MSQVADPPPLEQNLETIHRITQFVVLSQEDIERVVLHHYGLPPGTELVWDISSQGLLRTLTVTHQTTSVEP